jgi:hypothetical protein
MTALRKSTDNTAKNAVGTWGEQDVVLRTMWAGNDSPEAIAEALGRTVSAIMTRAARLGLPRRFSPGRKAIVRNAETQSVTVRRRSVRSTEPRIMTEMMANGPRAMRLCLMCVNPFQSHGAHNRICPKCKGSPDYENGNRLSDVEIVG